ncbi:MAG: hypothetical protein ACYDBB_01705 [Armatimonadota bacterium]
MQAYANTPAAPQGFDAFGTWINATVRLWAAQWQTWVLIMLVYLAIATAASFIPFAGPVLGIVLAALLMPGMMITALKQLRGEPIAVGDLFSGTSFFGSALLVMIATGIGALACGIGVLFTLPACFLALPILVDRNISGTSAISESWNIVKQNFLFFLVFAVVMNILSSAGVIACGIGILATAPWFIMAQAVAYHYIYRGSIDVIAAAMPPPYVPSAPQPSEPVINQVSEPTSEPTDDVTHPTK